MGNCQNFNPQQDPIVGSRPTNQANSSHQMMVKAFTWSRDSHGLFDYESKSISKKMIKAQFSGVTIRSKEEIFLQREYIPESEDTKNLAEVSIQPGQFIVSPSNFVKRRDKKYNKSKQKVHDGISDSSLWGIVKTFPPTDGEKGAVLKVGDYLKLGRVRMRVKEMMDIEFKDEEEKEDSKKPPEKQSTLKFNDNEDEDIMTIKKEDLKHEVGEEEEITCRICLDEDAPDNRLIKACKCAGTMGLIHIKCLQQWLSQKLKPKKSNHAMSFVMRTFSCELCHKNFPNIIEVDGKQHFCIEIPKVDPPYITLEILSKDKNLTKGIHVITLANKDSVKLGRGHDADIRIADISVSRCHAAIKYAKGKFFLEDNNSKFGSLFLIRKPMKINLLSNNTAVQVGRTVLTFQVRKNFNVFSVCFGGPVMDTKKIENSQTPQQNQREIEQEEEEKEEELESRRSQQPQRQQRQQIQTRSAQKQNQQQQQQQQEEPQSHNQQIQQQFIQSQQNLQQQQQQQQPQQQIQDQDLESIRGENLEEDEDENNILLNQNGNQTGENNNEEHNDEDMEQLQEMLDDPHYEQQDIEEEPEPENLEDGEQEAQNEQNGQQQPQNPLQQPQQAQQIQQVQQQQQEEEKQQD